MELRLNNPKIKGGMLHQLSHPAPLVFLLDTHTHMHTHACTQEEDSEMLPAPLLSRVDLAEFLTLITVDIVDNFVLLGWGGDCPVHRSEFSHIHNLYPLDAPKW